MTDKKRKALIIILVSVAVLALIGSSVGVVYLIQNNPPKSDFVMGGDSGNSSQNNSSQKENSSTTQTPSKNNSTNNKTPSKNESANSAVAEKPITELVRSYEFMGIFSNALENKSYYDSQSGYTVPYRLSVPKSFDASKKYPVILFLHGAGELGNDNLSQLRNFSCSFKVVPDFLSQAILIFPQTNFGWDANQQRTGYLDAVKRLTDSMISQYSGDKDRIYLTGLSMGSFATWRMLEAYPDTFAAAVPVCGGAGYYAPDVFVKTPIWIYHGTADPTVPFSSSEETYDAIKNAGGTLVNFTKLDGVAHNAWDYAYTDRTMFSWLFKQNKKSYQSMNYEYQYYFKVTAPNNKVVITEEDILTASAGYENGKSILECTLYSDGAKRLKQAYKNNIGKVFSLYYYGQKLCDFKVLGVPENDAFTVELPQDNVDLSLLYDIINKQNGVY